MVEGRGSVFVEVNKSALEELPTELGIVFMVMGVKAVMESCWLQMINESKPCSSDVEIEPEAPPPSSGFELR